MRREPDSGVRNGRHWTNGSEAPWGADLPSAPAGSGVEVAARFAKGERQMMPLSTIWNVDRTLDADGRSPVAERIGGLWDHDPDGVRFFRSSANFLYVFSNEGKRCFLRFADASERSREAVDAEIDLVAWLAGAGIAVAAPIPSREGNLAETVATELGTFHAVAFVGLDGAQYDAGELDGARFGEWGAALGELHAAMRGYPGGSLSARDSWRDHLAFVGSRIPADKPAVHRELDRIASSLAALPANGENVGPIHGDFELDNLCWRDRRIGVLDFDDCGQHWYVADIAFALRDLFDDGAGLDDPRVRAFTDGYAARHPLDARTLAEIPVFSRLARLVAYARMARSLDLEDDPEHPAWLRGLAEKLTSRMAAYEASLGHGEP